ncbi:hypothetical protein KAW64_03575 [bacterium]|nr:hypothetical protein [bacterium]
MRTTTGLLVCVLCTASLLVGTSAVRAAPCGRIDAEDWMETVDEKPETSFKEISKPYREALEVYDYPSVFGQVQEDLEDWIGANGSDTPHDNLLHALELLNDSFAESDYADYQEWLAEQPLRSRKELKTEAQRLLDRFLEEYSTGEFQFMTGEPESGWFQSEYFVSCEEINAMEDCSRAEDFLMRAHTVEQLMLAFKLDAVEQAVHGIRTAAARWEHFLDDGKTMYPWEAGLNAWLVGGGDVQNPPMHQWILVHPQICASISSELLEEVTARDAFCVEMLGHIWYSWQDDFRPAEGLDWWGVSAIAVFRDDMRPGAGLAIEYGKMMTLGVAWHDENEDDDWFNDAPYLVLSIDLLSFTQEKAGQYREFRREAHRRISDVAGW